MERVSNQSKALIYDDDDVDDDDDDDSRDNNMTNFYGKMLVRTHIYKDLSTERRYIWSMKYFIILAILCLKRSSNKGPKQEIVLSTGITLDDLNTEDTQVSF
jgi:hypothetical protein